MMKSLDDLCNAIIARKKANDGDRLFTVAISGIDASGKGYVSAWLQRELVSRGFRVANVCTDPWQHPIPVRLKKEKPAENVYENLFRWDDFFEQLIFPLQANRGIYLATAGLHTHADEYYPLVFDYKDLDMLIIEGVFLFKKKYLPRYDLKIWIECSYETGLQRALKRNSERLTEEELVTAYHTWFYPAQRLHARRDNPRFHADLVFENINKGD